ncbi:MAG TPA: protein-disulfide reductase DsbD domain-containing protein [Sphingomonas sp.]|nr:protein-disulfide reductase DsbD domain-containing protein [Sphingomonas sp.]
MALAFALISPARAAIDPGPHIIASLVPESDTPAAGEATTLAIVMTPQPGWHGYWKNPGDSGLPLEAHWTLPRGASVGEIAWPVPTTLVIAGLMNHVYEKPYALLVPLKVPAGLARGAKLSVSAKLDYLVCTTSLCVPESAAVSTVLTVGDGAIRPATAARFDAWRRALPRPLGSSARFEVKDGKLRIAIPFPAAAPLHDPHVFAERDGAMAYAAPQSFTRDGDTLIVETKPGASTGQGFAALLATGDGAGLTFQASPGAVPAAGSPLSSPPGGYTVSLAVIAFLGAVLGGLILNIMPCVFPILSLKALSLARAGGEEREVRREALAYTVGVILVCLALGGLLLLLRAGGEAAGWAFQLQNPSVILVLLLLTAAIGLNLAGLFELGAITAGSGLALRGGLVGAFWTGALAAFVATPCTGPIMAGALGATLVLPTIAGLLVFAGLGFGLALPFLLLGFAPPLRRLLPKPGAWMETFRRILAVPMLLTSLGLVWVLGHETDVNGAVTGVGAALLLGFGLWMTGLRQRGFRAGAWAPAAIGLAIGLAGIALLPVHAVPNPTAIDSGGAAERFDAARLASLRAEGKPVFLYFTADWCLSCKVNEKVAIDRAETQAAFRKAGVVTMVGDWTRGDPAITRFLNAHGRSGVPLYLWYAPGKQPKELPQILTPGLLTGLAES